MKPPLRIIKHHHFKRMFKDTPKQRHHHLFKNTIKWVKNIISKENTTI